MDALFIGQTYIDVTILADEMPTGDEKTVARDFAVSFGGNAVTAAFACARLGVVPDLVTSVADDWLGRMFLDMAARYHIPVHARKVRRSSLSFIIPHEGKRAILRARDDDYLHPFPLLNLGQCRALHLDGHQADAAMHYAKVCREMGMLTSLDGGGLRSNTHELLAYIDVAVVAERLCEQMKLSPTFTPRVFRYASMSGGEVRRMPALAVPRERVIDTSGAGDVYHGAYMASWLTRPDMTWADHFEYARAAAAWKIQHVGNEAGLPTPADIGRTIAEFG